MDGQPIPGFRDWRLLEYRGVASSIEICASTIPTGGVLSFIGELLAFLRTRKIYWLGPALVMLVLVVLLLLNAGSLISPSFRYFEY